MSMTDSINTSHAAESQCLLTALLIKALYFVFISLFPPLLSLSSLIHLALPQEEGRIKLDSK